MRILVIEDNVRLSDTIADALRDENYMVDIANDGLQGYEDAATGIYDILILDLMLPKMNGYEVLSTLRNEGNDVPELILSARTELDDKIQGFTIGADDYVTKPFNPLELVARVKSQIRRYTTLSSSGEASDAVYEAGGLVINDDLKKVTVDGEEVKLTPIEYNILLLLVRNQGKVFSISQIYENIWNEEVVGVDNTVAVHIRHIREKIEINPKEPRYLKVVWGVGYKIEKSN